MAHLVAIILRFLFWVLILIFSGPLPIRCLTHKGVWGGREKGVASRVGRVGYLFVLLKKVNNTIIFVSINRMQRRVISNFENDQMDM